MNEQLSFFTPDPPPTATNCTCRPRATRKCGHCSWCDRCLDCGNCAGGQRPSGRTCRCACNEEEDK
jgi:hypothetical protein